MERILGDSDNADGVGEEHVLIVEGFEAGDLADVQAAIRAHAETGRRLAVAALDAAGGVL